MACYNHKLYIRMVILVLVLSFVSGDCSDLDLGMESGSIPDSNITASSTLNSGTPAKNGRLNFAAGSSWCATAGDSNPYLQIDLQTLHFICAVSSQGNSQADKWVETYSLQTSADGTNWTDYTDDTGQVKAFTGNNDRNTGEKNILYEGILTRWLRFVGKTKRGQFCMRTEVFGVKKYPANLALKKPTAQSSTYNHQSFSENAVDGVRNTYWSNIDWCTHTLIDNPSWWRVDLGSNHVPISDVFIINLLTGHFFRSEDLKITLGDNSNVQSNPECVGRYSFRGFAASAVCYNNPLRTGRYVGIMHTRVQILNLCEVEVYSRENLAYNKSTAQISDANSGLSSRAVDGNSNTTFSSGSCSQTGLATNPWWRVDLGRVEPVNQVYIVNRGDCCGDLLNSFEIRVGPASNDGGVTNPICGAGLSVSQGEGASFFCRPSLFGQYVTIRSTKSGNVALSLCEVEVYSARRACEMQAVGLASRHLFPDSSFSASSSSVGKEAFKGRLNGVGAWSPSTDGNANDYLQINLQYEFFICAVATQGNPNTDHWTKKYKLLLSLNDSDWVTYQQESGADKIFNGNDGRNDIVKHNLTNSWRARFIRFVPTDHHSRKALRVEVYGVLKPTVPFQPPDNFTVTAVSSTSITASWKLPSVGSNSGIIKGFKLFYKKRSSVGSENTKVINDGNTFTKTVTGLLIYTEYEFQVFAFTLAGDGPKSSKLVERTNEDAPSAPAFLNHAVLVPSVQHGPRVRVTWSRPVFENGKIRNYTLFYSHSEDALSVHTLTFGPDTFSYVVDVLGGVKYQFFVRAVTIKPGTNTSIFLNTREYVPRRGPDNVSSTEVNYTTFHITWAALPKEAAFGNIIMYQVRLFPNKTCAMAGLITYVTLNTSTTEVLLSNLFTCTAYGVAVRAYTIVGPGPYSKLIVVQTLGMAWSKEPPVSPSFLRPNFTHGDEITAKIKLPRFPGSANFFQVIVITFSPVYNGVVNPPQSFTPQDLMTYGEAHRSATPAAYVTFQFGGNDFDKYQEFVVGNTAKSSSTTRTKSSVDPQEYENKPLQPNTNYRVFLRAFVSEMVYISSNFVEINTKEKPVVQKLPERQTFAVGDLMIFTCEVSGDPEPSVIWTKDGDTNIPRAQFKSNNRILVITNVLPGDKGVYECKASNVFGEISSATVIVVAEPPHIEENLSTPSVICEKQTVCFLSCHATSDDPISYSWKKNGETLDNNYVKVMNNTVAVKPRDEQDYGVYVCNASSSFGYTTYNITLSESSSTVLCHQSLVFRVTVIAFSCVAVLLLIVIGLLLWRKRQPFTRKANTSDKYTCEKSGRQDTSRDEQVPEPGPYMELKPRTLEGQSRAAPEYQELQSKKETPGYYNLGVIRGETSADEQVYEQVGTA